ncbi:hypothetical protein ACW2Q0_20690 [Nocardia sp. R16R-3T]
MTTDSALVDIADINEEDTAVIAESEERKQDSQARLPRVLARLAIRHRLGGLFRLSRTAAIVSTVVLGLLLGGTTVTTVLLERSLSGHRAVTTAVREARDSAQSRVPKVLSYDFNTVDTEFPTATQNLTGKFHDDFGKLVTSVIIPAAHRDSIVTKATIVGAAVVSAGQDEVTLLLFLNQETTSTKYQGPRLDGSRVRVTMARDAGTWLVSDITPV